MNVLIITYYFLPSVCANAKRPFYIAQGFLDKGWNVDVVTSKRLLPSKYEELLTDPNLTIRRIDDCQDHLSRGSTFRAFIAKLLRGILWPDSFLLWALKLTRKVDLRKYDSILVCIMPISLLIYSLLVKVDDRWVFDFSESFAGPKANRSSPLAKCLRPLLNPLQAFVLRKARAVVFTSETTLKDYVTRKLVSKEKAYHIPLFYKKRPFTQKAVQRDIFKIAYAGQFGSIKGVRSPKVFFQALNCFFLRCPQARKQTRFIFHGPWNELHSPFIHEYMLADVVKINPPIPYEQYLNLLEESSVLLLIASSEQNMFIPSKMLDYFGAQRPILAFVPYQSETREILVKAGMEQFTRGETDSEGGAAVLEQIWNKWNKGENLCENTKATQFSVSAQMPAFCKLLGDKHPEINT